MNTIYKLTTRIAIFIIFCSFLFITSTALVSYSLKGKPLYLKQKENKTQSNINHLLDTYTNSYSITTRNNTTYVYTTSNLTKEEYIALLTNIYLNHASSNFDIQIVNTFLYDQTHLWATITPNGVGIS